MLFVCLCKRKEYNILVIRYLNHKARTYDLISGQMREEVSGYKFSSPSVPRANVRYSNGVNPVCFLNKEKKCSVDL